MVHSLALFEDEDVLCVSDRENQRIDCLRAGLSRVGAAPIAPEAGEDDGVTGAPVVAYAGVGRSFGVAAKGTALLSVSGAPGARGITLDTAADRPRVLDQWGKGGEMGAPHDVAISRFGDAVYVADIDPSQGAAAKRVHRHGTGALHKFEVVRGDEFP